jgi:hypothetical protein
MNRIFQAELRDKQSPMRSTWESPSIEIILKSKTLFCKERVRKDKVRNKDEEGKNFEQHDDLYDL